MDSYILFIIRQDFQDLWDYWLCLFPDETGKFHSLWWMFLRCGIFVSPRRLMVRNLSVIQFPFQARSGSLQLGPRVVWTNALLPLVRQQLHPQHTSRFIPSLSIGALKFIMITARGAGWFSFALVSRQRKRKNNLCVLCASVVNF